MNYVGKTLSGVILAVGASVSWADTFSAACRTDHFTVPTDTTLVSARVIDEPARHCRVDGYVTTTNPGPNRVNFMLALPEQTNGRYLFTVQGGSGGFIPDPLPAQLRQGYAIAATDKGVQVANGLDFTFRNDPAQALDWSERAVHVTAEVTQAMVRSWYDKEHLFRYIMGCSGGGDGTLSNAEEHPGDFDGYVAAAMATSPLEISSMWGKITQHIVLHPDGWLSAQELQQVEQVLMAAYDDSDGVHDGLIWNPAVIRLDRQQLKFLNDAQFTSLQILQEGINAGEGAYFPGHWLGNVTGFAAFTFGFKRPPWAPTDMPPEVPAGWMVADSGSRAMHGQNFSMITDMDFSNRQQLLDDTALNRSKGRRSFSPVNLDALKAAGGKLILWSGMSDQSVSPQNILNYTRAADSHFGAERPAFIRTFLAPGMFHCSGGVNQPTDVPDVMLEAMTRWVEQGQAPVDVLASRASDGQPVERTYRLCPWPQQSVFTGDKNSVEAINDAGQWQCR